MKQSPGELSNPTEAFLYYLERRDLEMLDLLLDEEASYFGVSKATFLEALTYIFNQVKLAGSPHAICIKKVSSAKNRYRISWFNDSDWLVIDILEKDSRIIELKLAKKPPYYVEERNTFYLCFGDDELKDFKPSVEYLLEVQQYQKAYEELVRDEPVVMDLEDLQNWLSRHQALYEEAEQKTNYAKPKPFRTLYFNMELLLEELELAPQAEYALNRFRNMNKIDMEEWLDEFNRLYYCETMGYELNFQEMNQPDASLKSTLYPNLYFKGEVFFTILEFNERYMHYTRELYEIPKPLKEEE